MHSVAWTFRFFSFFAAAAPPAPPAFFFRRKLTRFFFFLPSPSPPSAPSPSASASAAASASASPSSPSLPAESARVALTDAIHTRMHSKESAAINQSAFMLDLSEARLLRHGDGLVLSDGRIVKVIAEPEPLMEIRGRDGRHLLALAWQIGNRHLAAQIDADRILIRQDHVIRTMLEGLGAQVRDVNAPFDPEGGAYGGAHSGHHHHDHDHGHRHHDHDHGHHGHGHHHEGHTHHHD